MQEATLNKKEGKNIEKPDHLCPGRKPLGTAPVGSLITKFAIPAIISVLVSALYNIVDQIFIARA